MATGRFVSRMVTKYEKGTIEATNLGVSIVLLDMKKFISEELDNEDNTNGQ
ncbi:MAG: hypothetical protein GXO69_00445 [Acidobacteria bacterium]|nr:hypothetical protein [Acidobacteriota bacterium]